MYLSKLTLNPNPACRAVQRDLGSPYELHRTLMRAFPDKANGGPGRVLFRLEPTRCDDPPVVLVQSETKPDWSRLNEIAGYLLDAPRRKEIHLSFHPGQRLRFRLRANPTVKRAGKRHGLLRVEDQRQWLQRKGERGGFKPVDFTVRRSARTISRKSNDAKAGPQTHLAVDFEGILEVTDPDQFVATIAAGVGSGKGHGFGLLSVAPPG